VKLYNSVCLLFLSTALFNQSTASVRIKQKPTLQMLAHNPNARPKRATPHAAQGATPALQSGLNFAPVVVYGSGGYEAFSVAVADVNGDGKPDLLVANYSDSSGLNPTVGVLLGNGDGTFQASVTYSSGGYGALSVTVADVNGDGKPDVLVANACGNSCSSANGSVGVLLGNDDGTRL
jgi:hypothetical protein